jgi:hypothetical protein
MFLAAACSSPGLLLGFLFCLTSPTIILVKALFGFGVLSPFEVLGLLRLQKLENGIEKTQDLDILYYRFESPMQDFFAQVIYIRIYLSSLFEGAYLLCLSCYTNYTSLSICLISWNCEFSPYTGFNLYLI